MWSCRVGGASPPRRVSEASGSYPGGERGDRLVEGLGTMPVKDGLAEVRAVMRMNPEQASRTSMSALSLCLTGEGYPSSSTGRDAGATDQRRRLATGVLGTARTETRHARPSRPAAVKGWHPETGLSSRPRQESEGLMVPVKPVKAGGGTEPWSRHAFAEKKDWRVA